MQLSRRSFLAALGMTGASVAFARPFKAVSSVLRVPEDLREWDGAITPEWIAAEGIRLLAAELPYEQFKSVPLVKMNGQPVNWPHDARQFGVDFQGFNDYKLSRQDFSRHVIHPPILLMANEITEHKPKSCYPLALPKAVEAAVQVANEKNGFNLRYVQVYDVSRDAMIHRFDMLTA